MFTIGAFGIITNQAGRVLLCHRRDYDLWNLPGGGVEPDETPWSAVVREVLEETGLAVEVTELLGVYAKTSQRDVVFSFGCRAVSGTLQVNDEADELRWFPPDELPENISRKQAERIHDAVNGARRPVLREQTGPSSTTWAKRTSG